jgi:hypothetical protein
MCPLNGIFPSGSQIKLFIKGKSNNGNQNLYSGSVEKLIKKETARGLQE